MSKKKSIYVAGPMTGLPEWNFPAFYAAEERLQKKGWNVINPARNDEGEGFDRHKSMEEQDSFQWDYADLLLNDLDYISGADSIYLLRGWEHSKGARAECAFASALGKEIIYESADMKPRLILLGGAYRAGKDTVADYLVEKHDFVKIGMSDPLLKALVALDPWVHVEQNAVKWEANGDWEAFPLRASYVIDEYGYTTAKAKFPEIGRLLQNLGTEVGRNILGKNVWTDIATDTVALHLQAGRSVVLTGVRFPNELEVSCDLRMMGSRITSVYVDREPALRGGSRNSSHASENGLTASDFSRVIDNNGTLEDLYAKTEELLS